MWGLGLCATPEASGLSASPLVAVCGAAWTAKASCAIVADVAVLGTVADGRGCDAPSAATVNIDPDASGAPASSASARPCSGGGTPVKQVLLSIQSMAQDAVRNLPNLQHFQTILHIYEQHHIEQIYSRSHTE